VIRGQGVDLTNTGYTDGPSVALGTAGIWLATGTVTVTGTSGDQITCKLWDATTLIDSGFAAIPRQEQLRCPCRTISRRLPEIYGSVARTTTLLAERWRRATGSTRRRRRSARSE
jgi:hypothetical protein